jgi:hypothetical protein
MLDSGNFIEAAKTYEIIAAGAKERGMLKQAPNLYFEAAKARLSASQPERGYDNFKKGLQILADTNRWAALRKSGQISISELNRYKQEKSASELKIWLEKLLADHPHSEVAITTEKGFARSRSVKLPPNCVNCGASINPAEVEWITPESVVCSYCGSVISINN